MPTPPYDLEEPPASPPPGADPLLWWLAHGMHTDHRPAADGFCLVCRAFWPCDPRRLAERGLVLAFVPARVRHPAGPGNAGHRW